MKGRRSRREPPAPAPGGRVARRGGAGAPPAPTGPREHRGDPALPAPPGASLGQAGADEPPPLLGRWGRLYALVALELLAVILALLWLTRRFA
ncbi:MAG: hypothetical protein A2W00_04785 [Candidatus Eisenbacteria bacterium RBG_16_71_46]|nr:MAG: hypothetical protein A2W00_04785 [Candidatus Eisenbacteria bacterium RBG_16_71_46]